MKKTLASLLLFCLILSLSACGSLSLASHTEETAAQYPGHSHSLSAAFDTRMFMGSSVLGVSAGDNGAQKLWYGGKTWYVIGYDGSNMVTSEKGAVTLFYNHSNESTAFNGSSDSESSNAYAGSNLESTINSWVSNFGSAEQKAIISRSLKGGSANYGQSGYNADNIKGSSDNAVLWPLSEVEAKQLPKSIGAAGGPNWWLRSPGNEDSKAQYADSDGSVKCDGDTVTEKRGIRPAFYLNTSAILFTSSADAGKTSDEWKVTLKDDGSVPGLNGHGSFHVTDVTSCDGNTLLVDYAGASTGSNEYISVVIVNSRNEIRYYDRLENVSSSSGTIAINIEGSLAGEDTLYMFNEQYNGDKKTSYSSGLNKIPIRPAAGHDWKDATCTDPRTCRRCGATEGDALGHEWAEASCTDPKTCKRCGATEGSAKGHEWEITSCTEPKKCKVCGKTEGEAVGHDWEGATCTTAKTCKRCGTTEGEPLGHDWKEATCTDPKTCKRCNITEGSALGHTWIDATCTEPKTCSRCKNTEGSPLGHDWVESSCTEPRKCSRCEAQESEPQGHTWQDATCTKPRTCSKCGATEGEPIGHKWQDATCTVPKTCSVCGATEGQALGHTWIAATCTEPKTCSVCKATEGEALGHKWVESSCTEPRKCSVCGVEEGKPLGHEWQDATCTKPKTCSKCGATEGEALGHKWKDATCTTAKTCERCNITEGNPLGHDWKSATCTEAKTCSRCGTTEGEPLGHKWTEASCTEPRKCSVCGTTEGSAAGHDWKDATCTEPKTCKRCKVTEGSPLGHDWKDATCTDPKKCSRCGASEGKALGHTPGETVKENEKPATCEQKGSYDNVVYCKVCKAELSRKTESTAALGHNWDEGKVTKNPTCEAEGEKTFTCKNDKNHIRIEKIKATGHSWDEGKITKNPTCEAEGEKTFTCKNDKNHTRIEKVKATGHSWDEGKITKNPTCEEEGEKTFTCKNDSKHTKVEKVKAIGHSWDEGKITKNPTCEAEGEKTFTCKNDAKHTKTEKVKALGHDWGEWKTTTAPGINAEGVSTRYCSRCDATETMKIPPLNSHTLSFDTKGGSAIAAQNVVEGTKPVKPQDPVREGYVFTGWYADSSCTTPFDFSKDIAEDTTVYAGWDEENANIPDDGSGTPDDESKPDGGNKVNPAVVAAVAVPVAAVSVGAAYYFINKKRLIQK